MMKISLRFLFVLLCVNALICQAAPSSRTTKIRNVSSNAPILHDSMLGSKSIMGESALMDKETGRIYWEGGSHSTISASISPLLSELGLTHIKCAVTTTLFFFTVLSLISHNLVRKRLFTAAEDSTAKAPWLVTAIAVLIKQTLFRLPECSDWFVLFVIGMYLLEAYFSETHGYLRNATTNIENFVEALRRQQPVVTWKVRSFHYEPWLVTIWKAFQGKQQKEDTETATLASPPSPSLSSRKVITENAKTDYSFGHCQDRTTVGVWKKCSAPDRNQGRFTKISLTKLLVLADSKARRDYFQQQADFVTKHGQSDEYAEFSTNIEIEGFQKHILAVKNGNSSSRLMFWFYTLLGLSYPFRIWLDRQCDELRVAVAKETYADPPMIGSSTKSWLGPNLSTWFRSSKARSATDELSPSESFRRDMQELSLYNTRQGHTQNQTNETTAETEDLLRDMEAAADLVETEAATTPNLNATPETNLAKEEKEKK